MRVLLINLPWREKGYLGVRAGSRWPFKSLPESGGRIHYIPFPFFLAYAASLLKKNGKEAKLLDAIAEGIEEKSCIDRVKEYNPSFIAAETSTPSFYNDVRILKDVKDTLPVVRIALCGSHASTFPQDILAQYDFIDYILLGEYEYNLYVLIDCLENNRDLDSVPGLAYRENKSIKINSSRVAATEDLNDMPWPERGDVPIYKYNDGFCGLPRPNVQMWASRGCPYQCNFCLWPQVIYKEHRYRRRKIRDVIDEMEHLIDKYDFKAVYFDDDTFNVDRDYTLGICREMVRRNIKVPWACMARADLMDEEILVNMKKAGLWAVKYGVESASQEILNRCGKNIDLRKVVRIIKLTRELGIKVHLTFAFGLEGETDRTIDDTIRLSLYLNPDSIQFSIVTPFPGTKMFNDLDKENRILTKDWSLYDGCSNCVFMPGELSPEKIVEAKERACKIWNARF